MSLARRKTTIRTTMIKAPEGTCSTKDNHKPHTQAKNPKAMLPKRIRRKSAVKRLTVI